MKRRRPLAPASPSSLADDEDADLWRIATRDVTPLPRRSPRIAAAPKPTESPASPQAPPLARNKPVAASTTRPSATLSPGKPAPATLRPLSLTRRRRRRIADDIRAAGAAIDLHGLSASRARDSLERFLHRQVAAGIRDVLVITGKGDRPRRDDDRRAISGFGVRRLRTLLPQWMHEDPFRRLVIAFSPAKAEHGGEGAWHLRLRRRERIPSDGDSRTP